MKRPVLLFLALLVMSAEASAQISKPRAGFGRAVAFAGDELLISEAANEATSGLVYVYAKMAGKWTETAALAATDGKSGDNFGWQIWPDGNRMIVAAKNGATIRARLLAL